MKGTYLPDHEPMKAWKALIQWLRNTFVDIICCFNQKWKMDSVQSKHFRHNTKPLSSNFRITLTIVMVRI